MTAALGVALARREGSERGSLRSIYQHCAVPICYNKGLTKIREVSMLWTIILILLVLWALGFGFAGESLGALVHILLVLAVIVLVLQLVRGSRV